MDFGFQQGQLHCQAAGRRQKKGEGATEPESIGTICRIATMLPGAAQVPASSNSRLSISRVLPSRAAISSTRRPALSTGATSSGVRTAA